MLRRYVVFFIALFSIAYCVPARAGLILCNNTGVEIFAAVSFYDGTNWISSGWYEIKPRDCRLPIHGPLNNRYVYYYAQGGGLTWEGGKNSVYLCADHHKVFTYNLTGARLARGIIFDRLTSAIIKSSLKT